MKRTGLMVAGLVVSTIAAACTFQHGATSTLSPSAVAAVTGAAPSFLGTWTSLSASQSVTRS